MLYHCDVSSAAAVPRVRGGPLAQFRQRARVVARDQHSPGRGGHTRIQGKGEGEEEGRLRGVASGGEGGQCPGALKVLGVLQPK